MKNFLLFVCFFVCITNLYSQELSMSQKAQIDSARKVMDKIALQKGKYDTLYGRVTHNTALLYKNFGDISSSEALLYEEMEIYTMQGANQKGQRTKQFLEAKLTLAAIYFEGERFTEAIEVYKETLDLSKFIMGEDDALFIKQIFLLIEAYRKTGLYTEANFSLDELEKIYKTNKLMNRMDYVDVLLKQADIMVDVKLFVDTAELLETAIEKIDKNYYKPYKSYTQKDSKIDLQLALAEVYRKYKQFTKAENLYRQVLQAKGETSNQYIETLEGLALTLQRQKKFGEALTLFERQKAYCLKKFGNKSSKTALALTNLADFYASQEKLQQAETAYNEAIKMLTDNKAHENPEENPEYATILAKLGNLYESMFLFQNAIKPYEQCLKIRRSVLGEESKEYLETLNDLATIYQKLRLYEKAEPYFREYITSLNAEIVNHFPALNDAEKAAYYSTNQPYFENFMRYALDRSGMNPYNPVQSSRTAPKVLGDLYNLQLSTKAILLSSSSNVRNKILSSKDTSLINSYRRWIAYKEQIGQYKNIKKDALATLGINLDSLEKNANSLERNLALKSTTFAQGYTKINLPTWEDIQKKLQPNEAAIEIISLPYKQDTTVYIALIVKSDTQNQPEAVVLGKGKQMDNSFLKTYRNSIKYKIADKQTYTHYWQPISEKLQGITKVYVSPDGAYHQVNLNTLLNPATEKYLIDEINIVLLTNTKDILQRDDKTVAMSLVDLVKIGQKPFSVLFGRPSYHNTNPPPHPLTTRVRGGTMDLMRGVSFTDLLGTELEIMQIDSSLKSINFPTKTYLKEAASEFLLKNLANLNVNGQSPTILHIATHGFFLNNSDNLSDPMLRSGIALAGINDYLQDGEKFQGEDGIFKASEIMLVDLLNTEVVGVSACETGLGDIKNGEGVYGLQRALKVAGAKAILMSLWKVDDTATQLLMSSFYAAYTTHDKRTAFRMAQQKLKEKYKEPFYWGAFVMVGE